MAETDAEEGMGSGTASGVALVPAKVNVFIAETRPETTEPIIMPTVSVSATNTEAKILRGRAQANNSFTYCPMAFTPLSPNNPSGATYIIPPRFPVQSFDPARALN